MTANESLADAFRIRQVYLFRHQASVRNEIERLLSILQRNLTGAISQSSPNTPAPRYRENRVEKLVEEALSIIRDAYKGIRSYHEGDLKHLAEAEALWLLEAVSAAVASKAIKFGDWNYLELVRDSLIAGAPVGEWWKEQSAHVQSGFSRAMRMGLVAGDSDAQLIARTRTLIGVTQNRAKILVRGASSAVVSQVRKKAVLDNPDVFRGIQQVSVFDGRTSDTCIAYAGKVWRLPDYKPVGHRLPYNGGVPRHPNCRSTEIAVLTEEYGEPPEDISFETFLKGKSPAFVNHLLGKGRADMYLNGHLSLSQLVDQTGRALTLEEIGRLTK